jgi:hypothetical protein
MSPIFTAFIAFVIATIIGARCGQVAHNLSLCTLGVVPQLQTEPMNNLKKLMIFTSGFT